MTKRIIQKTLYVKEKNNWPHQTLYKLENLIQGCEIEFINAGLPGYDTKRMLDYWKYKVSKFNVDLVIILSGDMTGDIQISARLKGFKGNVKNLHSSLFHNIFNDGKTVVFQMFMTYGVI